MGCLFTLLIVSFVVQKLFNLMQSHVFTFALVACAYGITWEIFAQKSFKISQTVSPMYSLSSFIVVGLEVFNPFFIFVCGERWGSNCVFLYMDIQFSQHHLLKRLSFPQCMFLAPFLVFVRFVEDQMVVDVWCYFWGLYSVPLVNRCVSVLVPCCFGYCSLVVLFEVRRYTSSFVLFA